MNTLNLQRLFVSVRPRLASVASVGLIVGLVLAAPTSAHAQTAAEKAAAEALFDEGKKLVDTGQMAEACPKFEESQRLDAGLGTLLYLADCYERAGRTASAWATFREAAATARAANQADREQIARARAEALEAKLHRLALRVDDASEGLTLTRVEAKTGRREPLARATWGVALPIDPGSYRLEASAPGKAAWSSAIEVPATAGTTTTVVPVLAAGAASPAAPVLAPSAAAPPARPTEGPGSPGSTERAFGITLGAAGIASLAVSGVFTAIALSNDGDADDLCGDGDTCASAEGVAASEDAVAMGNVATALFVVGGALVATSVVIYLTAPDAGIASAAARRHVAVEPSARGADAGLSLRGRF